MEVDIILSILSLAALMITLDVDNVVFVAILTNELPVNEQKKARLYGLLMGVALRAIFLTLIGFLIQYLHDPIIPALPFVGNAKGTGYTAKDLIMMIGGLFLLYKATTELYNKLEGAEHGQKNVASTLQQVMTQILIVDLVFSIDGVITAVGMVKEIWVMIIAMLISSTTMFFLLSPISNFVSKHPSMKVLAISFLLLIGVTLFIEGVHMHIPKGYIYFAMAFSLGVEVVNINILKKGKPVELHGIKPPSSLLDGPQK